jgi:hypothetical protein
MEDLGFNKFEQRDLGPRQIPEAMESTMPHHRVNRYLPTERTLSIFGISFNPVTGKWSTFSEDTKVILSEHMTQDGAHAACRRYEAAAWRRLTERPLADLAHRSI